MFPERFPSEEPKYSFLTPNLESPSPLAPALVEIKRQLELLPRPVSLADHLNTFVRSFLHLTKLILIFIFFHAVAEVGPGRL